MKAMKWGYSELLCISIKLSAVGFPTTRYRNREEQDRQKRQ